MVLCEKPVLKTQSGGSCREKRFAGISQPLPFFHNTGLTSCLKFSASTLDLLNQKLGDPEAACVV